MTQECLETRSSGCLRVVAKYQRIRVFIQVVVLMAKVRTIRTSPGLVIARFRNQIMVQTVQVTFLLWSQTDSLHLLRRLTLSNY